MAAEAHCLSALAGLSPGELRCKAMEDAMAAERSSLQAHLGFRVHALTLQKGRALARTRHARVKSLPSFSYYFAWTLPSLGSRE